ncbi:hypothetical protein FAF44_31730 [Nonomuraea sp. MG754425]|uniref:DUF11 domain-containing protein n=1 Tax=Nonomuraea sp. MG754425 TaxID=2570319 RepID=UPI001F47837B|nr:DUF11 domain-containing protein [Nonomuraea sp. MG754425]MCF6472929.1 hypothetical protein [Nonomuraea sp. MG754425]
MRRSLSLSLAGGLAAAALAAPAQASATTVTAPAAATRAAAVTAAPFSNFKISVKHSRTTKRGGKITYYVKAKNLGPHYADYYFIGGQVPSGVKPTLRWGGPKGTKCEWSGRWFWCWGPMALSKGKTDWLNFQVTLKSGTKGTATARVGVLSFDVDQGMENMSQDELKRLGIKHHYDLKTARTRIVTPPRNPGRGWTPPPPVQNYNPPAGHEESNKKKDT